jgi:PTS system nitrogen regulatory IIA component
MNPVGELLHVDDILLDVDVPDREALLERISTLLAQRAHLSAAQVLASLEAREELGSTALGYGVAIPHARIPECAAAAGLFVRTRTGVAFDAPDHRPVTLFLALLVPKQATERHLQLLAAAATLFSEKALREKLRSSSDPRTVWELLGSSPV